jgi:hypothetical protein
MIKLDALRERGAPATSTAFGSAGLALNRSAPPVRCVDQHRCPAPESDPGPFNPLGPCVRLFASSTTIHGKLPGRAEVGSSVDRTISGSVRARHLSAARAVAGATTRGAGRAREVTNCLGFGTFGR